MTDPTRTSSIKLGLAIVWPAFWTGVPLKIVLILLLLAAGLHPWEMPALAFLLLLSIPIDIWALGLTSRGVFLERLRREPPEGLGLTLWWQMALLSVIYFPLAYVVESQTIGAAKAVAAQVLERLKNVPVAERIGIELVLWGSVALVMLIILLLAWLYAAGLIVRRQAANAQRSDAPFPVLVQRWDLMRVPGDQTLALTVFVGAGVALVLLLWAFMPVTTPHPHEEYKKVSGTAKVVKPLKPAEVLQKTETVIAQAESSVQALEAKGTKEKGKDKGADAKSKVTIKPVGQADTPKAPVSAGGKPAAPAPPHDSTPHSH